MGSLYNMRKLLLALAVIVTACAPQKKHIGTTTLRGVKYNVYYDYNTKSNTYAEVK